MNCVQKQRKFDPWMYRGKSRQSSLATFSFIAAKGAALGSTMCGVCQSVLAHMQYAYVHPSKYPVNTCTVNWFNEHLYSKLVLCVMSVPCTFLSLVMSVSVIFLF